MGDSTVSNWIDRAAYCADQVAAEIKAKYPGVVEVRDPDGKTVDHLYFMARTLARRDFNSETKACRWIGYLQAGAVFHGITDLETEKERNLASRHAPAE